MMLQLQVDCSFGRGEGDLLHLFSPWDFIDLSNVLSKNEDKLRESEKWSYLSNEAIKESLAQLVPVCVPLKAMHFAERMKLLDS